jgi:transposase
MVNKQKRFRTDIPTPNGNISLPYGLVLMVEHYLGLTGVLDLIDGYKKKGVPMRTLVKVLCVHMLTGSNSMSGCADWLSDPNVLREMGVSGRISQRTLNRALNILGGRTDEILKTMFEGFKREFNIKTTDVSVDGSAVAVHGPKAELGAFGHPRDKNPGKRQVEFTVAELSEQRMPLFVRTFKGNASDAEQYRSALPDIMDMLEDGSWIVMDNGGAAADILSSIVDRKHKYLTRVKMNASDDMRMHNRGSDFQMVEDGVCCLANTFESSGRTSYLFYSQDLASNKAEAAVRKVEAEMDIARKYDETGKMGAADFVVVRKNPFAKAKDVKFEVQTCLDYRNPDDVAKAVSDEMGVRCGYFKLESSEPLEPKEALRLYRRRVSIEHLISALKQTAGIKPLRVWKESSIRGAMLLALLSEAAVAMARFEMKDREEKKKVDGKTAAVKSKPSELSIVRSLSHLTVTRVSTDRGREKPIFSNWEKISTEIVGNIAARAVI